MNKPFKAVHINSQTELHDVANAKREPTPPGAKQIVKYTQEVRSLVVHSPEERASAVELIRQIKTQRQAVVDFFKDMKQKAHEAWKAITTKEAGYTKALDQAEQAVKNVVLVYDREQERLRLLEERRLQAEAEAAAEKERKRLEGLAKRVTNPLKKDALLAQAAAVEAAPVEVASSLELSRRESYREVWKARIVDEKLIPRTYLVPNEKLLSQIARESKGQTQIPGVAFYAEQTLAVGT